MAKQEPREKRRDILKTGAALAGFAICSGSIPVLMSGCESDTTKSEDEAVDFDITNVAELSEVGGAVKQQFEGHNNGRSVVVIRTGETTFAAMTAVCPHQGCEVDLPATAGANLVCQCHASAFDSTTGAVLQGPAASPLQTFTARYNVSNNTVNITF